MRKFYVICSTLKTKLTVVKERLAEIRKYIMLISLVLMVFKDSEIVLDFGVITLIL